MLRRITIFNFELFFCIFLFALCFYFPPPIYAEGISLSVYPPIYQIEVLPPASFKAPVRIINNAEEPVKLDIIYKPFKASDKENGDLVYLKDYEVFPGTDTEIYKKVQLLDGDQPVTNLDLGPKQEKKLILSVKLPKNEPLADYYFSVVFLGQTATQDLTIENAAFGTNEQNYSSAQAGIAFNVLLSIGPKDEAKGYITDFSSPVFLEKGPVPFNVRIRNAGSHFMTPKGKILIKNFFGQTIGDVELLPVNILAGSTRSVIDAYQILDATRSASLQPFVSGLNGPKAVWPETFLFGPYSAELSMAMSEKGPVYYKTIHFFAFPGQATACLVLAALLILIVTVRVKKRLKN